MLAALGIVAVLTRTPAVPVSVHGPAASRAVAETAWPVPDGTETAVVEVLNGTSHAGLARTATRLLRSRGFDVVRYDNADSAGKTTLLVRRGDERRARAVAHALGVGIVRMQPDSLRRLDVTVILGDDFHATVPLHP